MIEDRVSAGDIGVSLGLADYSSHIHQYHGVQPWQVTSRIILWGFSTNLEVP